MKRRGSARDWFRCQKEKIVTENNGDRDFGRQLKKAARSVKKNLKTRGIEATSTDEVLMQGWDVKYIPEVEHTARG